VSFLALPFLRGKARTGDERRDLDLVLPPTTGLFVPSRLRDRRKRVFPFGKFLRILIRDRRTF
jgi:hypothetical protein